MTENSIEKIEVQPQTENNETETQAETIPCESESDGISVPVKFNGEIKNLSLKEASVLAQKGMKFDLIRKDFENLKTVALQNKMTVPQYIERLKDENLRKRREELNLKCSGDEELIEKLLEMEKEVSFDGNFSELCEAFPEITDIDSLPDEVKEASALKGTLLLDEYLRYRLQKKKEAKEILKRERESEKLNIGSQLNKKGYINPETEEFIKGLWK